MNIVKIDNREATEEEAEQLRNFVRANYHDVREREKPIQFFSFEYAQRKARENGHV
jgi:hypothetical protein